MVVVGEKVIDRKMSGFGYCRVPSHCYKIERIFRKMH